MFGRLCPKNDVEHSNWLLTSGPTLAVVAGAVEYEEEEEEDVWTATAASATAAA